MSIFYDADLQSFNDLVVSLSFKDTCTLERETITRDTSGGYVGKQSSWSIISTFPCIIMDTPKVPKEIVDSEQLVGVVNKFLLCPRNTDIHSQDRAKVNGIVYRVLAVIDPVTYEVIRRCLVIRDEMEVVS